jgi:hypothetical protein
LNRRHASAQGETLAVGLPRGAGLAVADAGVEPAIEQVRDKVEEALVFFEKKHRFGIIDTPQYEASVNPLRQKKAQLEALTTGVSDEDVYMFMVMLKQPLRHSDLFPLKRYSFNGHSFWGPQSSDALLSSLYGPDYKTIPDYERRNTRFSHVTWVDTPTP